MTVEAAIPDCSAGTAPSTAAVTETSAIPKPTPAIASGHASAATLVVTVSFQFDEEQAEPGERATEEP